MRGGGGPLQGSRTHTRPRSEAPVRCGEMRRRSREGRGQAHPSDKTCHAARIWAVGLVRRRVLPYSNM